MNFHYTASDTEVVQRVEDGHHILKAKLQKTDSGAYEDAELDLDTILGNNEGSFQWDGVNFSETAENVRFGLDERPEPEVSVPVLRASLGDNNGGVREADVNLDERIKNDDGKFVFQRA